MLSWSEFELAAPDIASVGASLLFNPQAGEVAILATVDGSSRPWVAPVCPIFTTKGVYLLATAQSPKVQQLQHQRHYALHALLGADDLEFQMSGKACVVQAEQERADVLAAVPFPSFDPQDPIFELLIERALTVTWPEPGTKKRLAFRAGSV